MHRVLARLTAAAALVAMMLVGGTAFAADNQPTNVGSSEVRPEPDPLTPGPHCHVALAADGNRSGFDAIVTATRHHAHVQTIVRGPGGIFDATACP
jgi:hypothetical protein